MAESAYGRLDPAQQLAARAVFLRLAGEGDLGSVRRRVRLEELDADDPDVAAAVVMLTVARLLTAGEGYVEVAHEALLREWPRLRAWIDEDGAGRQLRLHLITAARAWDEGGREHGDLYRGARLGAVLDWSAEHLAELQVIPAISEGVGDLEGAVQFAEDDRHIVVVDAGVVKVLTVDVDELVSIARSRFTRELTDEECRKYLHQDTCSS